MPKNNNSDMAFEKYSIIPKKILGRLPNFFIEINFLKFFFKQTEIKLLNAVKISNL
jgi:hypothetical protein